MLSEDPWGFCPPGWQPLLYGNVCTSSFLTLYPSNWVFFSSHFKDTMASPGKDNCRMKSYKNKALNPQEMRRRREEEGIQLRKQKREEQVKWCFSTTVCFIYYCYLEVIRFENVILFSPGHWFISYSTLLPFSVFKVSGGFINSWVFKSSLLPPISFYSIHSK